MTRAAHAFAYEYFPDGSIKRKMLADGTWTGTYAYDGENRPAAVTRNANAAIFSYGPDGERAGKAFLNDTINYLGKEAELLVNAANPSGLLTSYLHPDVKRETCRWESGSRQV